jgi:methylglyoxal synthase
MLRKSHDNNVTNSSHFHDIYGTITFMNEEKPMTIRKNIALVAHDHKKQDLIDWCLWNREALKSHQFLGTGTTGKLISEALGFEVERFQSGPLGGDQQIGAKIVEREIDILIFFWDPLEPMSHDPDIKALLRLAVLWNIPTACNVSTADFLISSPLFGSDYARALPDFSYDQQRRVDLNDSTRLMIKTED